jgi:hypothetical protein
VLFRTEFPQLVAQLDDAILLDRISQAVRWALQYKLSTGEALVAYVGMALAAGPAFNGDAKVRHYMELPGHTPDEKVRIMFKRYLDALHPPPVRDPSPAKITPPR